MDQAMVQKVIDHRTDTIMARLGRMPDAASPTTRPQGEELRDVNDANHPSAPQDDAASHDPMVNVSRDANDQGK